MGAFASLMIEVEEGLSESLDSPSRADIRSLFRFIMGSTLLINSY